MEIVFQNLFLSSISRKFVTRNFIFNLTNDWRSDCIHSAIIATLKNRPNLNSRLKYTWKFITTEEKKGHFFSLPNFSDHPLATSLKRQIPQNVLSNPRKERTQYITQLSLLSPLLQREGNGGTLISKRSSKKKKKKLPAIVRKSARVNWSVPKHKKIFQPISAYMYIYVFSRTTIGATPSASEATEYSPSNSNYRVGQPVR